MVLGSSEELISVSTNVVASLERILGRMCSSKRVTWDTKSGRRCRCARTTGTFRTH